MAATAVLRQEGDLLDYSPSVAVAAGDVVVQGDLVGIATNDIAANALGAVNIDDVFRLPKTAGAGTAIGAGLRVYWDATNKVATRSSGGGVNRCIGTTTAACLDADVTVDVKLAGMAHAEPLKYSAVAASTAVTNTVAATPFDKSATVPANTLKAGDVLRVRAQVIATATNATDTLLLAVTLGGTTIIATAAVDVANNDIGYLDVLIAIRTVGAAGTVVAAGTQALGTPGTVTAKPANLASTVVNTTVDLVLAVVATWSVANAGNSCRLDLLTVEKLSS